MALARGSMSGPITYMGTKRQLAQHVASLVSPCRAGPLLDAFSGMCSVGSAVAPARAVWSNDAQCFARIVAEAKFVSSSSPPSRETVADQAALHFADYVAEASEVLAPALTAEEEALSSGSLIEWFSLYELGRDSDSILQGCEIGPFASLYSGTYFGYRQAVEIDAIRSYISTLENSEATACIDEVRWLVLALGRAASKVSTTTGHFAQPMSPKANNIKKYSSQRSRSVWEEWLTALTAVQPEGTPEWRSRNRVFQQDAEALLDKLRSDDVRPVVVYADPPYTKDQYSRYYHVLETLVANDLPRVDGAGRYRPDRFVSKFCLSSQVEDAIQTLIAQCAELGADLVLSYPTNGLLEGSRERISDMCRKHFGSSPSVTALPHLHSTMGGSKGAHKSQVTEVLYKATAS